MKRRYLVELRETSTLVFVCVIAFLSSASAEEPVYKGKLLSECVTGFSSVPSIDHRPPFAPTLAYAPTPEYTLAWDAVDHAGTNALPLLLWLAGSYDTKFSEGVKGALEKVPFLDLKFDRGITKQCWSTWGFAVLRERAYPAIPDLIELLKNPKTSRSAIFSLHYMGADSAELISGLEGVVESQEAHLKMAAMSVLGKKGTNALAAAPCLINQFLNSTNQEVSAYAAVTLTKIGANTKELAAEIKKRLSTAHKTNFQTAAPFDMYFWALSEIEKSIEQFAAPNGGSAARQQTESTDDPPSVR